MNPSFRYRPGRQSPTRRVGAALCLGLLPCFAASQNTPPVPDDPIGVWQTPDQEVRSIQPQARDAVVYRNQQDVIIQGLRIDADVSIELYDCENVTIAACDLRSIRASNVKRLRIYNSFIHDSPNNAINLDECDDVVVQGNRMERVASGVYAHRSSAVQIVGNSCIDVQGPMPRGQLVQFDKVTGPRNLILANAAVNHHGRSTPEDMINLFQSTGTAESPIRVELNLLAGDPAVGSRDMSDSGSGIMLGDGGGHHQLAVGNTLINPGQVGIGVAGGGDIAVISNTIVGTRSNVANVGIYTWNQYKTQPAGDIHIVGNRVAWINAAGKNNPYWNGEGFTKVTTDQNRFDDATLQPTTPEINLPPLLFGQVAEVPYALPVE